MNCIHNNISFPLPEDAVLQSQIYMYQVSSSFQTMYFSSKKTQQLYPFLYCYLRLSNPLLSVQVAFQYHISLFDFLLLLLPCMLYCSLTHQNSAATMSTTEVNMCHFQGLKMHVIYWLNASILWIVYFASRTLAISCQ